jgi:hypothetical protein
MANTMIGGYRWASIGIHNDDRKILFRGGATHAGVGETSDDE